MTDQEFLGWLRDEGYVNPKLTGDGMWVAIRALMFHWTMHYGAVGDTFGYEDRWCYADQGRAQAALDEWASRSFAGEPGGWRRHPQTARRRNDDGDPISEYVAA
jgi:hypothetical protein